MYPFENNVSELIFFCFQNSSSNFFMQFISNGYVCVDSFFLISGTLLSYLTLKELDKIKGRVWTPIFWPMFYIHRYLRYVSTPKTLNMCNWRIKLNTIYLINFAFKIIRYICNPNCLSCYPVQVYVLWTWLYFNSTNIRWLCQWVVEKFALY